MENINIKVSKEVEEFLAQHSVVDNKYFFVPFWYEKIEEQIFKAHSLEKLPENLKNSIQESRQNTANYFIEIYVKTQFSSKPISTQRIDNVSEEYIQAYIKGLESGLEEHKKIIYHKIPVI